MATCFRCNGNVVGNENFCPHCGEALQQAVGWPLAPGGSGGQAPAGAPGAAVGAPAMPAAPGDAAPPRIPRAEQHIRGIAATWGASAALGIPLSLILFGSSFMPAPQAFVNVLLHAGGVACAVQLWRFRPEGRNVALGLTVAGLLFAVVFGLAYHSRQFGAYMGGLLFAVVVNVIYVAYLFGADARRVLTDEYSKAWGRVTGVAWWKSPFFIIPAILAGIGFVLGMIGGFLMALARFG